MIRNLFDFTRTFFTVAFPGKCFFLPALFAWFQIERMTLNFFYDIFLLDLPLKTAQSTLQGFPVLEMDFCQFNSPPSGSVSLATLRFCTAKH
jgi:hypothetical protein